MNGRSRSRPAAALHFSERRPVGFRFTERMAGTVDGIGELVLTLTVLIEDLHRFVRSPRHEATFFGTARAEGLAPEPLAVTRGRVSLLAVDPRQVQARRMCYRADLVAASGEVYALVGRKFIGSRPAAVTASGGAWADLTRLEVTITRRGGGRASRRRGTVRIDRGNFARQLRTLRASSGEGLLERVDGLLELARFFGGIVLDTYGGPFARAAAATCDAPVVGRGARRPSAAPTRCYPVPTDDGVEIGLRRYRHGRRGPVLLSPGFGMSSRCFWLDTVAVNLVDYLAEREYDIWCLDYRASPDSRSAGSAFSIDDIALRDYPAAVRKVLAEAQPPDGQIQAVVHCVGSMSFLMALLAGAVPAASVRSVVCSQLGLHPITPEANRWKAKLRLASLLRLLGERRLDADYDERRWSDWSVDKALRLWPTIERCTNGACRRITFMFGETYRHDLLNLATHDGIQDMFGVTSVTAFEHLALMVRRGHAVDRHGEDRYLPHIDRLAAPISFIHGARNREFLPASTAATHEWLRRRSTRCRRTEFPEYGHLDCFIGRRAHRDVFPTILDGLETPP